MTTELDKPLVDISELKICKDCESVATSTQGWENFRCLSKENILDTTINLVSGDLMKRYKTVYCKDARENPLYCGKQGRWFVKNTFISRLIVEERAKPVKPSLAEEL